MPKASTKKTASALSPTGKPLRGRDLLRAFPRQIIALGVLLFVVIGLGYAFSRTQGQDCAIKRYYGEMNRFTLFNSRLPYNCVYLEQATTPDAREQGLSGRASIDSDTGMLFVMEQPQQVCLWMNEMRFSIDMIWLDGQNRITKIEPNVAPNTFPKIFCQNDTLRVVELKAGVAEAAHLRVGNQLKL
jgi:uncharacterized membrane protein (UPF0127 family)